MVRKGSPVRVRHWALRKSAWAARCLASFTCTGSAVPSSTGRKVSVLLLCAAGLMSATTSCGRAGDESAAGQRRADVEQIEALVGKLLNARGETVCNLLTERLQASRGDEGGGCAELRKVQTNLRRYVARPIRPITVGDAEIVDRRLHFDDRDSARLIICYGSGEPCVSDLGAEELTLEKVAGEWLIDGHEYHVEDF